MMRKAMLGDNINITAYPFIWMLVQKHQLTQQYAFFLR